MTKHKIPHRGDVDWIDPNLIAGHDTTGVAICNHVRSFDIEARVRAGTAKYIETIDKSSITEIIHRVISVIEPTDYIQ